VSAGPPFARVSDGRRRAGVLALLVCAAAAATADAEEIAGISADGSVVTFDTLSPGTLKTSHAVTGLAYGELIVGMDFRPIDGALYAVGSTSRLYRIDPATGFAMSIGTTTFTPLLDGTDFGVSFDVAGEGIRITSDTGQNLVLDPDTGTVASVDPTLTYVAGDAHAGSVAGVVACAWTTSPTTGDVLYGIDLARGLLVKIETPTAGAVRTVGPLGLAGLVSGGFTSLDASPDTGIVYAVVDSGNDSVSREYIVNLGTGGASQVGGAMTALLRAATVVPESPPAPPGTRLIGLVQPADLLTFTTDAPGTILRTVHVRGLPEGDSFVGVAERPANGYLYGITRTALYDIDLAGGTAAPVGANFYQPLAAGQYGCDFDPATDRLRVVSAAGVNIAVDPSTGAFLPADTAPAFAAGDPHQGEIPAVRSIAFIGRDTPGTTSTCFVLESADALLARLGDPLDAPGESRDGLVSTIGPLAIDGVFSLPLGQAMTATGDHTAYAALQTSASASSLFHVDLVAGRASYVAAIGTPAVVRALTAEPTANPPRVYVGKLTCAFNYRRVGRDSLTLKGAAPFVVGTPSGKTVTIDVGGLTRTFVLNAKGTGKTGYDTLHIGGVATHGISLKLVLKRENLSAAFADEQMDGSVPLRRAPRQLVVTLTVDGRSYRASVDLSYSANPGKSGSATTN
jgi:hypothetical protein